MMPGVDMNRVHLWIGLTHPVFGPMNLAWYLAHWTMSTNYACYVAWVDMLINATYPAKTSADKPRTPD